MLVRKEFKVNPDDKHIFKSCVEGTRYILDQMFGQGASENYFNILGNAWTMDKTAFGKKYDVKNDKNFKYQVGDLVVFDRPEFKSDKERGIASSKLHLGVITGFDDNGKALVTHYIPKKLEITETRGFSELERKNFWTKDGIYNNLSPWAQKEVTKKYKNFSDNPLYKPGTTTNTKKVQVSTNFTTESISKVSLGDGKTRIYSPNTVIRLTENTDKNISNSARQLNGRKILIKDNYGDNVKDVISTLNNFDVKEKTGITSQEESELKLATLGYLGLESDFGGSKRMMVRSFFSTPLNIIKSIKRKSPLLESVGYGSIKPELIFLNTSYPDLDEKVRKGEMTRKQASEESIKRTSELNFYTNLGSDFGKLSPFSSAVTSGGNMVYNKLFDDKYHPDTRISSGAKTAHWLGVDTQNLGKNIKEDSKIIYSLLIQLHRRYPDLSGKQLVEKLRGSKMNEVDSKKFDKLYSQFYSGTYNPSTWQKAGQYITNTKDDITEWFDNIIGNANDKIKKVIHVPLLFRVYDRDQRHDKREIDYNFLTKSEQNELANLMAQAVMNGSKSFGYRTNKENGVYGWTDDMSVSGGGSSKTLMHSITKNLFDSPTQFLNTFGLARIIYDPNYYILEDTYDFNNPRSVMNIYQAVSRNPQPYAFFRQKGTLNGSAPGVGIPIRIKIPKEKVDNRINELRNHK